MQFCELHRQANIQKLRKYYGEHQKQQISRQGSYNKKLGAHLFDKLLAHYGAHCACCGEEQREFLTIDHVHGGGNQHRKALKLMGLQFWRWVIGQNYPSDFQVLCYNCNLGKNRTVDKQCPHEKGVRHLLKVA